VEVFATRVGVEVPLAAKVGAIVRVVEAGGSEAGLDWEEVDWLVACEVVGAGPESVVDVVSDGLGLGFAWEGDGGGPVSVELVGTGTWLCGVVGDVPWFG
jgi:hypothetical protein